MQKQQIKGLPSHIIGIQKTNNVEELAEIYTASDVFLNLCYQNELYHLINLMSIMFSIMRPYAAIHRVYCDVA